MTSHPPPLYYAALNNAVDFCALLLNNGATLMVQDSKETPLHCACDGDAFEAVQFFVNKGLNIHSPGF